MKFVLAPDSFKESLTAKEVADAMEVGIKKIFKDAECVKVSTGLAHTSLVLWRFL